MVTAVKKDCNSQYVATSVIFADDMSIIITSNNKIDFENALQQTSIEVSSWFRSNLLTLNCDKTHFLQFLTTHKNETTNSILYFPNY